MKFIKSLAAILITLVVFYGNAYPLGEGGISSGGGSIGGDNRGAIVGDTTWWMNGLTFWAPLDDPANPLKINKSAAGTSALTFTRATSATYVHPTTGLITTATDNVLRIESNGALIEGQRTNLALYSEQLGLAATWIASNVTVDNNTAVAPDGATTAETLTATADNATLLQAVTGTAAAYTNSLYLKRKTGTGAVSVSADNTTWTACTINDTTWTRCTDTRTLTVATYYHGVKLATNADAVYAWGGGAELGAFSSSYIGPTTTAAVTRNADVFYMLTAGGNWSNTTGSLSVEADTFEINLGNGATIIWSEAANFPLYRSSGIPIMFDGTNFCYDTHSVDVWDPGITYKMSVRWGAGGMGLVRNAGTVETSAFDGSFDTNSIMRIGSTGAGSRFLWGHMKNLRIWNRQLTDTELQNLTR